MVGPGDVILPAADIEAIERHTVGIAELAPVLRGLGRHLKRGLLLYGPPGTGKTLSVMYLCNRMPGRTTIPLRPPLLDLRPPPAASVSGPLAPAGRSGHWAPPEQPRRRSTWASRLDRPQPGALDGGGRRRRPRGHGADEAGMDTNPLLFQLLNEMDGLAEDADVIFVLTTNRVELLEPALAARPGRIDQAVEIRLPDAEARRRLLQLYLRGVGSPVDRSAQLDPAGLDSVVGRTEGASAAFIKELVRRATLFALRGAGEQDGAETRVGPAELDEALTEMAERSAPNLQAFLGAGPPSEAPPTFSGEPVTWAGGGFSVWEVAREAPIIDR